MDKLQREVEDIERQSSPGEGITNDDARPEDGDRQLLHEASHVSLGFKFRSLIRICKVLAAIQFILENIPASLPRYVRCADVGHALEFAGTHRMLGQLHDLRSPADVDASCLLERQLKLHARRGMNDVSYRTGEVGVERIGKPEAFCRNITFKHRDTALDLVRH